MKIDFQNKQSMMELTEAIKYYKEHKEEVKASIKEAFEIAKEIRDFCADEGISDDN